MSVETGSSTKTVEIFIPLLNEGTDVLRPTEGVALGPNEFRVLPTPDYDPCDEEWEFPPGAIVKCSQEIRSGRELLVARQRAGREPRFWCANFDFGEVLDHGLQIGAWLLQYQYEHGGFEYQGNRRQKGRTTATWKSLREVEFGDWLIAYLSGNVFFAVGRVVEPKPRVWQTGAAEHLDTIERTVREGQHLHFEGVVRYRDAPAFYEDFTDPWSLPTEGMRDHQPVAWPYAQRIDVAEWQHVVPDGVSVPGLATVAPLPLYRRPLFPVDNVEFVARVRDSLQSACCTVDFTRR